MSYNQPTRNGPYVMTAPKSTAVAYILWFLLGTVGAHKFYLGQTTQGIIYALLGIVGYLTVGIFVGLFLLAPLYVLLLVDLFTIPGKVRELNTVL